MQIPKRKPGKQALWQSDFHLTESKLSDLKKELKKLINISRPKSASEVRRLAELGDFSENAAYQMAKGKLRGINNRINELENRIKQAVIIKPSALDAVSIGHQVMVEISGKQKVFTILGSTESNPDKGIISHVSPVGSSLLGRRMGEEFSIKIKDKTFECKIISIE